MLPIYICEDEEKIRDAERTWLEKQILIEDLDMEITLCTASPEELLKRLAQGCGFDELVVDVGQDLARPEEVLSWSDDIYMIKKEDAFSRAKLEEYTQYLKLRGYEPLLERIRAIPLERLSDGACAAQLNQWQRWERLAPEVRRILAEEENDAQ